MLPLSASRTHSPMDNKKKVVIKNEGRFTCSLIYVVVNQGKRKTIRYMPSAEKLYFFFYLCIVPPLAVDKTMILLGFRPLNGDPKNMSLTSSGASSTRSYADPWLS